MNAPPSVLYYAPGSGLGHLNRALAVCLELRALGVSAEIVTNSPFAEGVARLARFPITRIPTSRWAQGAIQILRERAPCLAVTDTFPQGFRNEWLPRPPVPLIYMARRLKPSACVPQPGEAEAWSGFARVILAEPLSPCHDTAIRGGGADLVRLPGPVRLAPGSVPTPVPEELERLLEGGDRCLVVHGGPENELELLVAHARAHRPPGGALVLITPWDVSLPGVPRFDYYPAGNLVDRAANVVSGAGYNILADMMFLHERHTAIPFERRYDDQAGRLRCRSRYERDGTREAACAIAAAVS